ncbi:hypothetical protein L9F63_009834, partial [Diploptera punctata]
SEESIYSTVAPIFYVSKLFGLAPLNYVESSETRIEVKFSPAFVTSLIFKLITQFPNNLITTYIPDILLFSSFSINSIISIILAVTINKDKLKHMLVIMNQADKILFNKDSKYYITAKRDLFLRLIVLYLLVSFVILFDCIIWTMLFGMKNLLYFNYYLDMIINWTVVVQFMNYLILLKDRFKQLNGTMINLLKNRRYSESDITLKNLKHTILLSVITKKDSKENKEVYNWTYKDILHYNLTHELLFDATKLIISMFEIQIVISTFISFLSITIWVYFGFNYFFGYEFSLGFDNNLLLMGDLILSATSVIKLLCITLPSHAANCEIAKTDSVLRKLLLIRDMDRSILDEVQRFQEQVIQRQIKITALGFLNLDLSLFFSVMGAVFTYLVILVQ